MGNPSSSAIAQLPGGNSSGTPNPFPGNVIPKSCFYPGSQAILNLFPMPNTTIGGSLYKTKLPFLRALSS